MSDIDERLDSVLDNFSITDKFNKEHIELFKQTIKQLMADEFDKLIDYAEGEGEMWWSDGKDKLRQKLKEWKK